MNSKIHTIMNTKYVFISATIVILVGAQAKADSEVLRDGSGNVLYLSQIEASGISTLTGKKERPDACEVAGKGHLPTLRELAEDAQKKGAKGILEVSQVDPNEVPSGYSKISAYNSDGQIDEFYFNRSGYKRPHGEIGDYTFWSSSALTNTFAYAFTMDGTTAVIDSENRGKLPHTIDGKLLAHVQVRCFPDK